MIHLALELFLVVASAPLLAGSGYLFLLALLSRPRPPPPAASPHLKFEVVVPAHDEEHGIARTVKSLLALEYPSQLFRVRVIADNCTDQTALQAALAGANVLTRTDPYQRGKGYALSTAFEHCLSEGWADAVVVVDADSLASPNLLTAFAARLERGESAAQADYGVQNPQASWRTRLMVLALALFHRVRSQGRERLGVSCGLRGNGMCFSVRLLSQVPHHAYSLVEDLEYGIRLGLEGHRVAYVDEARVLGEMVSGGRAARSQRRRWEEGRRAMTRAHAWRLLQDGLKARSLLLLDLGLDLLVPPLTTLVAGSVLGTAAALLAWQLSGNAGASLWLFGLSDGLLLTYVLAGWRRSGSGARGLVDLTFAPLYLLWKLTLPLGRGRRKRQEWIRTAREGGPH